ncbi:MAG: hypothetical protein IPK82_02885 [Polyangiaceae bacterium]|nr:hypothetical protein [Polyangiaceae bacterium]
MLLVGLATALFGCGAPEPKAEAPKGPVDEWADLPKTPEWLHASAGFSGPHKEECALIEKWVLGESECQASSCEHARDLARDWVSHCQKITPDSVAKVKEALAKYEERSTQPDTACFTELKGILGGKCGDDPTCEAAAQRWTTRCAEKEGSPLSVQILVRYVQRRVKDHDVELDLRTCSTLRDEVINNVACGDRFKCEDAISKIDVYKARCQEEGDRPSLSLAMAQALIYSGADRKVEPILAVADEENAVKPKLPPQVADGSAVVINVCGTRVDSVDAYYTARKECEAGAEIVFAKTFKIQGSFEIRVGKVIATDTAGFIARYPSLLMPGERERFDKERGSAFETDLDKAAKLSADPKNAGAGVIELYKLFADHGREIFRNDKKRAAIKAKDASFVNVFKLIAKAKSKAKGPKTELGSIAARAKQFAYSDIDAEGAAQFGAFSWAALFDTSALFPESHAAYLKELKGFFIKTAKDIPPDEVDADYAKAFGFLAEECHSNADKVKAGERTLLECAFGQRTCDAALIDNTQKATEAARSNGEKNFLAATFFMTTSGPTAVGFYKKVMSTAQCEMPTW